MRKTLIRYLSRQYPGNSFWVKVGGERRKVTVLVSDLKGFSAISEQLPSEEVVKILNANINLQIAG
ncbi:hypothetical protein [Nostoc sp.]|uniref:hypothetical protein n=1 Tax=Nostoc sp. TaxID=1180 RepID=UPI002FF8122E